MKFITVALLALIVVNVNAFARIRHLRDIDAEQWQKQIDQYVSESTSPEDLKEKVSEYYSKLTEKQSDFVKFYRKQCTSWIKGVASDEEKAELRALYQNKDGDVLAGKINDYVNRLSENERAPVLLWKNACAYLWNIDIPTEKIDARRVRRSTTSHNILSTEWLTDEQTAQLEGLENDEYDKKYLQFFKELSGDTKHSASKKIVKKCYGWLEEVASQEERDELKNLHHSDHSKCKEKVQEYLGRMPEAEREKIKEHLDVCEEVWYAEHGHGGHEHGHHQHRRRRDHHHGHKLEDYLKTHLSWLTTEQGETLKQMKADGKTPSELQKKVFEYFEATSGETRTKATELLKGGCRDLIKAVVGEDKAEELKKLKESGASDTVVSDKIKSYIAEVEDPQKKELAVSYEGACKKIFGVSSRKRRHEGKHGIDDFVNNHLTWLNAEQKTEIDKLKVEGNFAGIKARVNTFFEAATGETKQKATEELKGACRELYTDVLGDKANEVKALKESGASDADVAKKIDELIAGVTDEAKKAKAEEYKADCKKIYGLQSRKRRSHEHGEHNLEDYFKNHYSWLTEDQKNELRQMKKDGKKDEIWDKALQFFEAATGDQKEKAEEQMKGGCRELIRVIVGNEHADQLAVLKQSGASIKALDSKLHEFLGQVTDEGKKKLATTYGPGCRKIFGVPQPEKRKRRAFQPSVTHMDFIRAVVGNEDKPEPSHRALTYQIMDIYNGERLSERARNVVNQCHGLFGEIVQLNPYKNENSVHEVLRLLRSASDRQLKAIQAVAEVCKNTIQDLEETEGNHGSIGKTLIEMFKDLDDEPRARLREQWKSKCLDWILDVTDADERDDLKYFLRMGRVEVLQERITELMSRFDDKTRTQVGHMRPVCEHLLGFVHNSRKTFHRKVPVETVF